MGLKACRLTNRSIRSFLLTLEKIKQVSSPDLGLALLVLLPVRAAADPLAQLRALNYGSEVLAEGPAVETVSLDEGAGMALLLFGPYRDGERLPTGFKRIRGLLKGLIFDEEEIRRCRRVATIW